MGIPRYFCWTRFGAEAAQEVTEIIQRKEEERQAGHGIFLWGIGNAVGPSIRELLRVSEAPEVLFSAIKSMPKSIDTNPPAVAAWTDARGLDGRPFALPQGTLVTSRFDPASPKRSHYALVCHSDVPLKVSRGAESVSFQSLRNLLTQKPIGASQVTAVVQHDLTYNNRGEGYAVAIRARLVAPFFIKLNHAILVHAVPGRPRQLDFARAKQEMLLQSKGLTEHQFEMSFAG